MFFDEGWAPVSDVTAEVFRRLQGYQAAGKVHEGYAGLRELLAISVWDICDASTKVGATGADGTVVSASKDLMAWADPRELSNEHVDLMIGSVGSSSLAPEGGEAVTREELTLRYGPFLSLPLVLPVNNYRSSLTFLEEEVANSPRDDEVVNAAKVILTMRSGGQLLTRDTARAKLGSTLTRRKFKLAWALASQHHEELAAPNRWLGL